MTLDEAIERYTSNAEYERTHGNLQGCLDFKKLAEWLKDYKRLLEQEPCEDAISRQTVKEQIIKYGFSAPDMTVTEFIEDLPTVNPQQKIGHWIDRRVTTPGVTFGYWERWKCSLCSTNSYHSNYCPNCGAKMVKPQESEDKDADSN